MEQLKQQLWRKLKTMSEPYFQGRSTIQKATVRQFLIDIVKETQIELEYALRNFHRLDSNQVGVVSFQQLANFLFRSHCGQLTLQRAHRAKRITESNQRLLKFEEFNNLINSSFSCFQVFFPRNIAMQIFQSAKPQGQYLSYNKYMEIFKAFGCDNINHTLLSSGYQVESVIKGDNQQMQKRSYIQFQYNEDSTIISPMASRQQLQLITQNQINDEQKEDRSQREKDSFQPPNKQIPFYIVKQISSFQNATTQFTAYMIKWINSFQPVTQSVGTFKFKKYHSFKATIRQLHTDEEGEIQPRKFLCLVIKPRSMRPTSFYKMEYGKLYHHLTGLFGLQEQSPVKDWLK